MAVGLPSLQGYVTSNSLNYGNVPPLLTSGAPASYAWDKVCAGNSRLPALATSPPALVINALGFNDQNSDVTPAELTATVAAWLADMRAAGASQDGREGQRPSPPGSESLT